MAPNQMDLEAIKNDISEKANEAIGKAVEFAKEKPHAAVGIAFGVGWVLGNGLPPRLILAAARIGWKAALGGMLAGGGLASLLGGEEEEGEAKPAPATTRAKAPGTTRRTTSTQGGGV